MGLQVDVYIYDYGKLDIIVRLASQLSEMPALLYDPASTMCPIGIGASGLCVSRFTLYPRNETEIETRVGRWSAPKAGLPLTAILWELFLGSRNLPGGSGIFERSLLRIFPCSTLDWSSHVIDAAWLWCGND